MRTWGIQSGHVVLGAHVRRKFYEVHRPDEMPPLAATFVVGQ